MTRLLLERPDSPAVDKPRTPRRPGDRRNAWRRVRQIAVILLVVAAVVALLRFTVLQPPLVSVAEVKRGDVADEIMGTGTVTADVLPNISSKITGRVAQVFANKGDTVKKGQILAALDETDLRRRLDVARAGLAAAKVTAEQRERDWNREKGLVASGSVSVEEAEEYRERDAVAQSAVQAAKAELGYAEYQLSLTQVPSLTNGIVTKRWVNLGNSVVPGQTMFTVADTRLIYVDANIDQNFTGKIRKGKPATVVLRGREDHPLSGYVLRVDPQADQATEEMVAEVAFQIPSDEFMLGQWANVYVQVGEAKDALVVPRMALLPMGERTFVFVVSAENVVRQEPIRIVASSPRSSLVAVSGALKPGDRVVLMPMGLQSGKTVRASIVKEQPASGLMP